LLILAGGDFNAFKSDVARLDLTDRVMVRENITTIEDYLQAVDLGLFASESESFCLSILEAMAFACPSVSTSVGGIPEVIADGESGMLTPMGDTSTLAAAATALLADPARRARLGAAAQLRAREKFSAPIIVERYLSFYREVCGAGTLRDAGACLDMVRCGIALYGCSPFGGDPTADDLVPVMSWTSRLSLVKHFASRESVGYGRTWRAARGTWIGTIPVGYADGFARDLSNRGEVLVGGRRVPVVGTVSMDLITVDLGPEATERGGEEVVIIGPQGTDRITADEIARLRGTIPYEVTCAVSPRVARVHEG
jgi:hypothetical protein